MHPQSIFREWTAAGPDPPALTPLVDLGAGLPDDPGPFRGLVGEELSEVHARYGAGLGAEFVEALHHIRHFQDRCDVGFQLRQPLRADPSPHAATQGPRKSGGHPARVMKKSSLTASACRNRVDQVQDDSAR